MNGSLSEETMKKVELLWTKVGFVVQLSQMVEYNLANILGFDEILKKFDDEKPLSKEVYDKAVKKANSLYKTLSKRPLGKILEQAEKVKFFTEDGLKLLSEACEKRNFVIHHLFREDLFKGYVDTQPEYYYETVEETIGILHEINEQLVEIFKQQKQEYWML